MPSTKKGVIDERKIFSTLYQSVLYILQRGKRPILHGINGSLSMLVVNKQCNPITQYLQYFAKQH